MNNSVDFIAKVYETLANIFNFSTAPPGLFMQMAWPGIPIVPNDFKNSDGNIDLNIAEEVFSDIANIAPVFDKNKFEDSAFNIDDLYEIILASARPSGVANPELETNPMFKMFADALFEYMRSEKGSVTDPSHFYHASKASPTNWFDESAAQFWPKIEIKSADIPKANDNNPFVKNVGIKNIEKSVWKLSPNALIKNSLNNTINSKIVSDEAAVKTKVDAFSNKLPINSSPVNRVMLNRNSAAINALKMGKSPVPLAAKMVDTSIRLNLLKNTSKNDLMAKGEFKTAFVKSMIDKPIGLTTPITKFKKNQESLNKVNLGLINNNLLLDNKLLPTKNRIMLENVIKAQLPTLPASPQSSGFSVSFNFCRVNIDRPWLNLSLLKLPNWYIFDANSNLFSNGSSDNNPGIFPLLTTSFIVINNLKITANWSDEDKSNISNGVSFGPFDIRKGSLNQNSLEIPGMQIMAFISKVTPPLAPKNPSTFV